VGCGNCENNSIIPLDTHIALCDTVVVGGEKMAKSYEQKVAAYKATCKNMAALEVLNVKFQISSENADAAGHFAANAARWVFEAYPELREAA
jgi:hypothetical protein